MSDDICPISLESEEEHQNGLFVPKIITVENGISLMLFTIYKTEEFNKWLNKNDTDPETGLPLNNNIIERCKFQSNLQNIKLEDYNLKLVEMLFLTFNFSEKINILEYNLIRNYMKKFIELENLPLFFNIIDPKNILKKDYYLIHNSNINKQIYVKINNNLISYEKIYTLSFKCDSDEIISFIFIYKYRQGYFYSENYYTNFVDFFEQFITPLLLQYNINYINFLF